MGGTFFVGLTGLNASSLAIKNVGNNLANSNTIGYKTTNLFFEELRAAVSAGADAGQGVQPTSTQQVWSQGNVQQSQLATDMAIRGAGFFVVSDGVSSEYYTRAGAFFLNSDGKLVTNSGLYVLGYPLDLTTGEINTNTNLTQIDLKPGKVLPAVPTSSVRFTSNLNVESEVGDAGAFSTTVSVYDSLGVSHAVTLKFSKVDSDSDLEWDTQGVWNFEMSVPEESVPTGDPTVILTGTVTFDSEGRLVPGSTTVATGTGSLDTPPNTISGITFTPATGASDLDFSWEIAEAEKDLLTQFRLPSSTSQTYQNGKGAGTLSDVIVRGDGVIEGIFSNGETAALGQIGMAIFTSPQNLVRAGDNQYARTTQSGEPTIGTPGTGGRGEVQGNALELSNVDIAEEFIKLIVYQRAYQANSKIITTADQVTQQAIQLKQ